MKAFSLIALCSLALLACGPNSSPEGRTNSKIDVVKLSLDSLKQQNKAIQDSLSQLRAEIKALKR